MKIYSTLVVNGLSVLNEILLQVAWLFFFLSGTPLESNTIYTKYCKASKNVDPKIQ